MRTPTASGTAVAYTVSTIDVDGLVGRVVSCLQRGCARSCQGTSAWWFGTVDEPTHIYALCRELARGCDLTYCPHDH